jgi:hypothetical protein
MRKNTIRRRAQRAIPTPAACQDCGASEGLERHHPDYTQPHRVEALCRPCHVRADQRDGTRPKKKEKTCKVCGAMFLPSHSKKHTTCGPECLAEIGRRNARKRWGTGSASQKTPPA